MWPENPEGFRFCGACGAELLPAPFGTAREERKVVTVLFADLVGFTSGEALLAAVS